jgi:hypothetical protein
VLGLGVGLTGPLWRCLAGFVSGAFAGPVAGSVHEDLMAGVDESVEEGFGDDGVGEQAVPVNWSWHMFVVADFCC